MNVFPYILYSRCKCSIKYKDKIKHIMDHFDYNNSSSVSRLNSMEGIQFDGRAYALYGKKNCLST